MDVNDGDVLEIETLYSLGDSRVSTGRPSPGQPLAVETNDTKQVARNRILGSFS